MKTLLVPTDFSPISINALHYATDMAIDIGASLVLLNAYQIPVTFTEVPVVDISVEEIHQLSLLKLHEVKINVEHVTSGKIKIYTESRLGYVSEVIDENSEKIEPFLIIMGTKGHSGFEGLFMGSNTMDTIMKVKHPVLVVPPGVRYKKIGKIGFACDLKEVVETIPATQITKIVNVFGAELSVLNVNFNNKYDADTAEETLLLQTMLEKSKPTFEHIENVDVSEGIHFFAEKNCLDLLITIPKKHKLIQRLFNRSQSEEIIFQSHIPILCIHE